MLNGYIGHIVIYIPSNTMSGIGADGKYLIIFYYFIFIIIRNNLLSKII